MKVIKKLIKKVALDKKHNSDQIKIVIAHRVFTLLIEGI